MATSRLNNKHGQIMTCTCSCGCKVSYTQTKRTGTLRMLCKSCLGALQCKYLCIQEKLFEKEGVPKVMVPPSLHRFKVITITLTCPLKEAENADARSRRQTRRPTGIHTHSLLKFCEWRDCVLTPHYNVTQRDASQYCPDRSMNQRHRDQRMFVCVC
jgi:hypothetical protein